MRDEDTFCQATRPTQRKGTERWWAAAFRLHTDTFPRRRRRNNLRGNEAWRWMGTLLNVIGGVRVSREPCTVIRHRSGVRVGHHPNTRHVDDN